MKCTLQRAIGCTRKKIHSRLALNFGLVSYYPFASFGRSSDIFGYTDDGNEWILHLVMALWFDRHTFTFVMTAPLPYYDTLLAILQPQCIKEACTVRKNLQHEAKTIRTIINIKARAKYVKCSPVVARSVSIYGTPSPSASFYTFSFLSPPVIHFHPQEYSLPSSPACLMPLSSPYSA